MHKIGVIGGGNMGEAIINSSLKHYFVLVAEKDVKRQRYLYKQYKLIAKDIKSVAQLSEIIILAVKPQDAASALEELKSVAQKDRLIISICAGITTDFIERHLGQRPRVIRTMPNMPALVNQGITAVCKGRYARNSDVRLARSILERLGKTVVVTEGLIDAITAVSGSGPAYVYYFMECLIKGAQSLGLKEDLARALVKSTFLVSIVLLMQRNADPAELRAKVTSKGGTTQAALDVLMKRKFNQIVMHALKAAKKRAKELAKR